MMDAIGAQNKPQLAELGNQGLVEEYTCSSHGL